MDGEAISNNTVIDWGACKADTIVTAQLSITNTGNRNLTLTLIPYGYPAEWSLAWQYNNTLWTVGQTKTGWLNLTIPASAATWPLDCGFWINGS